MKLAFSLVVLAIVAALSSSAEAETANGLLYVTNREHNRIDIYPAGVLNPRRVGFIRQGIDDPFDVAVDTSGSLYVVNNRRSRITVYAPGQNSPNRILPIEPHHFGRYISVGPDGTVYVSTVDTAGRFFVEEFDPGASSPSRIVKIPYYYPYPALVAGIASDSSNDLYVNIGSYNAGGGFIINVYPPRAINPSYQIGLTYGYPGGGIEALGDGRIVVGDPPNQILVAPLPHPNRFQFRKIITRNATGFFTVDLASTYLYAVGPEGVLIYDFKTGAPLGKVDGTKGSYGIAVGSI